MKYEIDTTPLLERAFYDGKDVFVPKIIDDKLQFFQIFEHDLNGQWETGAFSIREPRDADSRNALSPGHFPCLVITPGLAFDRNGDRLGRGKGYYDRFFAELDAQNLPYFSVGLCMPAQIVERVPTKPCDKRMDVVLDVFRL
jgi:5-formyltetrahydrofolate cyclo-ligase